MIMHTLALFCALCVGEREIGRKREGGREGEREERERERER